MNKNTNSIWTNVKTSLLSIMKIDISAQKLLSKPESVVVFQRDKTLCNCIFFLNRIKKEIRNGDIVQWNLWDTEQSFTKFVIITQMFECIQS